MKGDKTLEEIIMAFIKISIIMTPIGYITSKIKEKRAEQTKVANLLEEQNKLLAEQNKILQDKED